MADQAWMDARVEGIGRWTASRWSRRSFLARLGRAAVLVAGGTTMAGLLADRAEARVCGQSGVAPKCETFACDATWGWCWYASGCCANGALKKICDCCAPNTPNPVGYCPSGTRVLCIVESCGADPRVMTKPVVALGTEDPVALSVAVSNRRFRVRTPMAVVGDAENELFGALAASIAGVVAGPVLLTPRAGLAGSVSQELSRLGVRFVKIVGPLSAGVDDALADHGIDVERLTVGDDPGRAGTDVAAWSRRLTGARTVLVVDSGLTTAMAGAAAAVASGLRIPLLFGAPAELAPALSSPRPLRQAYVVTSEAARAEALPGARPLASGTVAGWHAELAGLLLQRSGSEGLWAALAPRWLHMSAVAVAGAGGPVLRYDAGSGQATGGGFGWVLAHRERLDVLAVAGTRRQFTAEAEWWLQGLLNVYEVHDLRGQAGEGLPVIPQPRHERPIGRARWG